MRRRLDRHRFAGVLIIAGLLSAGGAAAQQAEQGEKAVARTKTAMASSSHPRVTAAILEVLRDGGNAVDAMLTAIPLQHVIEPQMSTLAGGMGGLIYWAKTGELIYLDAELDHSSDAPAASSMARPAGIATTSGKRVGVPGTVAGLAAAADRYGTREWKDYFGPAIEAASDGFVMYSFLYGEMSAAFERLGAHEATKKKWMPNGFLPVVGDTVVQPTLAATLRRLADEGPGLFTEGDWAQHFVAEVNRTGGSLTVAELAAYRPRWVPPVEFSYKGIQLRGAPPASTAGVLNGMILNMLEPVDLESMGHFTESAESLQLIRKAFAQAESFTTDFIADPQAQEVPVELLLSKGLGLQLASIIRASDPLAGISRPVSDRPAVASGKGVFRPDLYTDTNHLTIVDADGNWVSMTHTVYGDTFGTGLTVDGVGVNSGNTFPGQASGAGRRVITPFPALMAVDEAGKPWLALGSPGLSSRAVALTLINYLGYGMSAYESVDAPRFVGYGRYEDLHVESRIPEPVLAELEARGVTIHRSAPYNWHMGSIQLVLRDANSGELIGVADPRRAGYADGY